MKALNLIALLAICAAPCLVASYASVVPEQHGNNPNLEWVGVNIGGELFAMPADEYLILSTLTDFGDMAMAAGGNAVDCGNLADLICSEGQICCFCYSGNGNQSCSFSCQDSAGDCEPCPECGPDFDAADISYLAE